MKKALALLLSLLICITNTECKHKKINKASEFLKGAVALTAAAGLAYLAYEAPIKQIKTQWTKLKNAVIPRNTRQEISGWCSDNTESIFNYLKTSIPWTTNSVDKSKLFSLITIIPAYELTKYAFDKLGNSVRTEKILCEDKN